MKMKSAVTIQERVVLDVVALNLSSINGKPTNIAELSINRRNIEEEQTNKTTHARAGISSNDSAPALELFCSSFTPRGVGNALQELHHPALDTSQGEVERVRMLMESLVILYSTHDV